jgi:signal transduction histidine kinase
LPTIRTAERRLPLALVGVSLVFGLTMVTEAAVGIGSYALGTGFTISVATSLPFVAGIGYGGYWLANSSLEPDRDGRIAGWCLGGTGVFLAMNVLLMTVLPPGTLFETAIWLRWAGSIGAGTGLLIGTFEARAIDRRVSAERARLRAEEAESRRELLDYLNALLRHEVLNSANVIDGRAGLLLERGTIDAADRPDLETIQRRARDLTSIIEDARVLLQATTGHATEKTLDVVSVLEAELDTLTDYDRSVTVETDFPESASVRADDLLPRVFSNLFANAVEHHDGLSPTVSVTVETTPEVVRIAVADDGPGVPAPERDSLFECDSTECDHGLGLSLVATLLERYDGTIELTETGPSGSVFTVELPLAGMRRDSPGVQADERQPEATGTSGTSPGVAPD